MFSSPKAIELLPVVWLPPGLPVRPASSPRNKLLPPLVRAKPAAYPTTVFPAPVHTAKEDAPIEVFLSPQFADKAP